MNEPHTRSGQSGWLGWLVSLLLVLGILGVAWFAWSEFRAASATATSASGGPSQEQKDELETLNKENSGLEETLTALKLLLEAEPCDIPVSARGLSFVPDEEVSVPQNGAQTGQTPPAPLVPEAATTPTAKGLQGEGVFSASNELIEAATAMVLGDNGEGWSLGTGFFIAPGMLVTNRHVVEKVKGPVLLVNKHIGVSKGDVVAMSREDERDYALVRFQGGNAPAALPLCGDIRKTDKVATWGFPGIVSQADPKFQALIGGNLSAIPEEVYSEGVVNVVFDTMPPMILHTAVTSQGNSGGPLVNAAGCVVGINTMIQIDDESYRQTSVALSSRDMATFLWQNGITPQYRSEAQVKP